MKTEVSVLAKVKHQLEIIVNLAEPVAEINNVINAFLQVHRGKETEILAAVSSEIDAALSQYSKEAVK